MNPLRTGHLLGTHPGDPNNYFDTVLAVARASEAAGFDALFFSDHFQIERAPEHQEIVRKPDDPFQWPLDFTPLSSLQRSLGSKAGSEHPDPGTPMLECFTTLGALAAATERVYLGALVAGVPYRNPALLAKMNLTLDVISRGRCIAGVGAAWHQAEFRAYGGDFPPVKERLDRLEEAVQIIDLMMTQKSTGFEGRYYRVQGIRSLPGPIQKPRPPILIGGSGEKRTLRIVAQYADYCNLFGSPETVWEKIQVLHQHCEAVGRPPGEIQVSNFLGILIGENETALANKEPDTYPWIGEPVMGTPGQVTEALQAYIDAGTDLLIFNFPDAHTLDPLYLLAEQVLPQLAWPN